MCNMKKIICTTGDNLGRYCFMLHKRSDFVARFGPVKTQPKPHTSTRAVVHEQTCAIYFKPIFHGASTRRQTSPDNSVRRDTADVFYLVEVGHEIPAHLLRLFSEAGHHLHPLGHAAVPRMPEPL